MLLANRYAMVMLCVSTSFMISCGSHDSGTQIPQSGAKNNNKGVLNLYFWADFLAPNTISSFENLTGIKVRVSYFDSHEMQEARILAGHSGFDVVDPSAPYFQRQIRSGAYLPLDKKKLPNLANQDPAIMARVAVYDPGNVHGVVYTWGTYGIIYNEKMVAAALPNVPVNSWRLIFDPAYAEKLGKCGISTVDSPAGVVRMVLKYLGKDPNTPTPQDLTDVESVLGTIRPYIRSIDSANIIDAMANGDSCIALDSNTDAHQARNRAKEAKNGVQIGFVVPQEGSLLWFNMLGIPKDAPNPANAHLFLNYLMEPQVSANLSNFMGMATANSAALPLLDASIVADPDVYPSQDQRQRLFVQTDDSPEQARTLTRLWQKFKTAQ